MKSKIILATIGLAMTMGLSACGGTSETSTPESAFVLSQSIATIEKFETVQLSYENAGHETVSWSSSDSRVARVSGKGLVTGVSLGTATITARCGKVSKTCHVSVIAATGVAVLNFDASPVTLQNGSNEPYAIDLYATYKGEKVEADFQVGFEEGKSNLVVSAFYQKGESPKLILTPIMSGETTVIIHASCMDTLLTASLQVTVVV